MTIGVLAASQPLSSTPSEFLPKAVAMRLVRRGWADKVSKALIRRRAKRANRSPEHIHGVYYIPDRLPPAEVGGCHFQDSPVSLRNRTHILPSQQYHAQAETL